MDRIFDYIFARRCLLSFIVISLFFLFLILRIAVIADSDYAEAGIRQQAYRITLASLRGTIFDCNMSPITNAQTVVKAVVTPTPRAVTAISSVLKGDELETVLETLKSGRPAVCTLPDKIDCDGIICSEVFVHNSSDTAASHIIGYCDSDSHGVSGLEKAYDKLLYSDKKAQVVFTQNAVGEIMNGISPVVNNDTSVIASGIKSTIDLKIQSIAEDYAESLGSGGIVIADAKTAKIRAIVSAPNFDITNISEYLDREDSPLFNRALGVYNVGSAFKPCVAIAGLEQNNSNFFYNCTGSCKIIDRIFKCHKLDGHSNMSLKSAITHSCNTYFYNFSVKVGGNNILKTAINLDFGKALKLCDNLYTSKGSLPDASTLQNAAHLANFSIGQGELLLSPVSMLTLYCAIATDGTYYTPSLIEGTVADGTIKTERVAPPTRVMSEKNAAIMRDYLKNVVDEGTGVSAAPKTVTAAGKTGTAQTGKKDGDEEITSSWFCGFFPADSPKYTVIVFSENKSQMIISANEIFAQIADRITSYEAPENLE